MRLSMEEIFVIAVALWQGNVNELMSDSKYSRAVEAIGNVNNMIIRCKADKLRKIFSDIDSKVTNPRITAYRQSNTEEGFFYSQQTYGANSSYCVSMLYPYRQINTDIYMCVMLEISAKYGVLFGYTLVQVTGGRVRRGRRDSFNVTDADIANAIAPITPILSPESAWSYIEEYKGSENFFAEDFWSNDKKNADFVNGCIEQLDKLL